MSTLNMTSEEFEKFFETVFEDKPFVYYVTRKVYNELLNELNNEEGFNG